MSFIMWDTEALLNISIFKISSKVAFLKASGWEVTLEFSSVISCYFSYDY